MNLLEQAHSIEDQLIGWRRDIHQHPELGFEEVRTSALVAETLRGMGITVRTNVGKTGVIGSLGSGHPVIGIRADMDALPIQEANDVPYASTHPGLMHACGHDAHTAILLGVARLLSELPDRPPGEIRFLFQPCEEKQDADGLSGASRMISDQALDGVDAVIALHIASEAPVGIVVIDDGPIHAAADAFEAVIKGQGDMARIRIRASIRSTCWGWSFRRSTVSGRGVSIPRSPPSSRLAAFMPGTRPMSSRTKCG